MISQKHSSVEVVRFDRVGLEYGPGKPILYDLNYSFYTGCFYFLTGQSGAGKSSLLKLIYREIKASEGHVRVFGRDASTISAKDLPEFRQRMGLVFQNCLLLDHLNALDNVALALKIGGMDSPTARKYAEELLVWVGLKDHIFSFPPSLSDGQKQRVAIARAVITRPLLLLADEPTGNVDEENAFRIIALLEELNQIGTTVIVGTHDRNLVSTLKHPELNLNQGHLDAYYPQPQGQFNERGYV